MIFISIIYFIKYISLNIKFRLFIKYNLYCIIYFNIIFIKDFNSWYSDFDNHIIMVFVFFKFYLRFISTKGLSNLWSDFWSDFNSRDISFQVHFDWEFNLLMLFFPKVCLEVVFFEYWYQFSISDFWFLRDIVCLSKSRDWISLE